MRVKWRGEGGGYAKVVGGGGVLEEGWLCDGVVVADDRRNELLDCASVRHPELVAHALRVDKHLPRQPHGGGVTLTVTSDREFGRASTSSFPAFFSIADSAEVSRGGGRGSFSKTGAEPFENVTTFPLVLRRHWADGRRLGGVGGVGGRGSARLGGGLDAVATGEVELEGRQGRRDAEDELPRVVVLLQRCAHELRRGVGDWSVRAERGAHCGGRSRWPWRVQRLLTIPWAL
jgi:hypothetical protein